MNDRRYRPELSGGFVISFCPWSRAETTSGSPSAPPPDSFSAAPRRCRPLSRHSRPCSRTKWPLSQSIYPIGSFVSLRIAINRHVRWFRPKRYDRYSSATLHPHSSSAGVRTVLFGESRSRVQIETPASIDRTFGTGDTPGRSGDLATARSARCLGFTPFRRLMTNQNFVTSDPYESS